MRPIISIKEFKINKGLIFETRTHILENWIIFDKNYTGARIVVRAIEDSDTKFYLDMSIMDDDDYDYTVEFQCHNKQEFLYKLHLLLDWLNDIRGQYVFYEELITSIPL